MKDKHHKNHHNYYKATDLLRNTIYDCNMNYEMVCQNTKKITKRPQHHPNYYCNEIK